MTTKNKPTRPVSTNTVEDDIASIESMTDEEIDAELRGYGIDPQRAIDKVTRTVRSKMDEWANRGPLHTKKTVGHHIPAAHVVNGDE